MRTEATIALLWLLVPGATALAGRLGDLSDNIDELVAGQLRIQARQHDPEDVRYIAANILKVTEREVKIELGVGDLAKRRDPAWASAVLTDRFDESVPTLAPTDQDVTEASRRPASSSMTFCVVLLLTVHRRMQTGTCFSTLPTAWRRARFADTLPMPSTSSVAWGGPQSSSQSAVSRLGIVRQPRKHACNRVRERLQVLVDHRLNGAKCLELGHSIAEEPRSMPQLARLKPSSRQLVSRPPCDTSAAGLFRWDWK